MVNQIIKRIVNASTCKEDIVKIVKSNSKINKIESTFISLEDKDSQCKNVMKNFQEDTLSDIYLDENIDYALKMIRNCDESNKQQIIDLMISLKVNFEINSVKIILEELKIFHTVGVLEDSCGLNFSKELYIAKLEFWINLISEELKPEGYFRF